MTLNLELDEELWVLNGPGWRFPYAVRWVQPDIAQLRQVVGMLGVQLQAVDQFLILRAESVGRAGGRYQVSRHEWLRIAEKAPAGVNPELLANFWPKESKAIKTEPTTLGLNISEETDAFLRELSSATGVPHQKVEELFLKWQKLAMHWLLNKEKPVDMGFVKLHPTPFRSNWKSILQAKFPWAATAMQYLGRTKKQRFIYDSGIGDAMLEPDMLAYMPGLDIVYTGIEIEYKRIWFTNVKKHELEKLRKKGRSGYAKSILNSCRKALVSSHCDLFSQWLSQTRRPAAKLVDGNVPSSVALVPFVPKGCVRPQPPKSCPTFVCQPDNLTERAAKQRGLVDEPSEEVLQVPPVQPTPTDVRDSERDAGRSGQPTGMPVLDANEGEGGLGPVLVKRDEH